MTMGMLLMHLSPERTSCPAIENGISITYLSQYELFRDFLEDPHRDRTSADGLAGNR